MWKNTLLGVYTIIAVILVTLMFLGKIGWVKPTAPTASERDILGDVEKGVQLSQPQLFKIGDNQLICKPYISIQGDSYKVTYNFYEYVDGKLMAVEYANKQ